MCLFDWINKPTFSSAKYYFCCYSNCESSISLSLLQHFINQREEFETARDGILVWLTEMDLQLTNIEHFSECDIQAKIKQLRVSMSHTDQSFVLTMKPELMGIYLCSHSHSNRKYPSLQPKSSTSSTRERHWSRRASLWMLLWLRRS